MSFGSVDELIKKVLARINFDGLETVISVFDLLMHIESFAFSLESPQVEGWTLLLILLLCDLVQCLLIEEHGR